MKKLRAFNVFNSANLIQQTRSRDTVISFSFTVLSRANKPASYYLTSARGHVTKISPKFRPLVDERNVDVSNRRRDASISVMAVSNWISSEKRRKSDLNESISLEGCGRKRKTEKSFGESETESDIDEKIL